MADDAGDRRGASADEPFPITLCMLTRNEEDRLPASLAAVQGRVGRMIVLDAESDDRTVEIARRHGAEVVIRPWEGFVSARRHLLELAGGEWVLMLDADEVVEPGFWEEVARSGFQGAPDRIAADGFRARRRSVYLGKKLRRGWQPDWKTVLFRRGKARFEERSVHEAVAIDGRVERLRSEILHYSYRSVEDHFRRSVHYARLAAEDLHARGKRAGWSDLALRPAWAFFQHLVLRGCIVDGVRGWMVAKSAAISVYLRYAILWELQRRGRDE